MGFISAKFSKTLCRPFVRIERAGRPQAIGKPNNAHTRAVVTRPWCVVNALQAQHIPSHPFCSCSKGSSLQNTILFFTLKPNPNQPRSTK
ncbi:putative transporter ESBP6 [Fusarium oxysporum f. sp. albedinis]|nr:putative transporter ESBP6 [Fusarium oxysporum f. sp. albedinis]